MEQGLAESSCRAALQISAAAGGKRVDPRSQTRSQPRVLSPFIFNEHLPATPTGRRQRSEQGRAGRWQAGRSGGFSWLGGRQCGTYGHRWRKVPGNHCQRGAMGAGGRDPAKPFPPFLQAGDMQKQIWFCSHGMVWEAAPYSKMRYDEKLKLDIK